MPEIARLVLLRIISKVSGKNILNPKPSKINDMANSKIVSTKNDIPSPIAIAKVAVIRVVLVCLASLPATARDVILEKIESLYLQVS